MHLCITTWIGSSLPDLFTTPIPLPIVAFASLRLIYFLWYSEHINHTQLLDFLPSYVRSALSVWPVSSNITAFVVYLKSAYEGEHKILSLANFT
jgi:hypothetical protein